MGDYLAEQRMIEESERRSMSPTLKEVRGAKEFFLFILGLTRKSKDDKVYITALHALTKLEEELG